MKQTVQQLSEEVLKVYPIKDLVEGWLFKVREVSYGVYEVEGIDHWGRKVSRKGVDSEEVLKLCVKEVQEIKASIKE